MLKREFPDLRNEFAEHAVALLLQHDDTGMGQVMNLLVCDIRLFVTVQKYAYTFCFIASWTYLTLLKDS
jgi:hypothetical protein